MIDFDQILLEVSYRIPTGIINFNNESHRFELIDVLTKYCDATQLATILENLSKQFETVLLEDEPVPGADEYEAVSRESGKKVYFKTEKARDAAIQAGTHTNVTKAAAPAPQPVAAQPAKPAEKAGGSASNLAAQITGGAKKESDIKDKEAVKKAKKAAAAKVPHVKPVLMKAFEIHHRVSNKKDKSLGTLNVSYFKKSVSKTDVEFEAGFKTNTKFKKLEVDDDFKFNIPGFPQKYATLLNRVIRTEKFDENNPPLSFFYNSGGAGQISSQSAEVLMMAFSKLQKHEDRVKLKDSVLAYTSKVIDKSKQILDNSWITASYLQAESLHARLKFLHPEGYVIEQVAWDSAQDVSALGLSNYKVNKGYSTDVYFRIRKHDNTEYLLEDSLKKDEKVFLLNTSVNEIKSFAIKKLSAETQQQYNSLKSRYLDVVTPPSEKKRIYAGMSKLESAGLSTVDPNILPATFAKQQYASAMSIAEKFEAKIVFDADKKRGIPKIDDKVLMRAFGSKKADKALATASLKALKYGKFGSPTYIKALQKLGGKIDNRHVLKSAIYITEYFAATGDGNMQKLLEDHISIAKKFQKDYLIGIVTDHQLRDGLMDKIDESFPLRAFFEGEEQADIDSLPVFRQSMTNLFKTESYDELKTHLIVRTNERGEYELLYSASNINEAIPIAKINVRQKGIGYDQNCALEMSLHPIFAKKIAQSNAELGIITPGIAKQLNIKSNAPASNWQK